MRDLHTHTCFSDGQATPEEMVVSAIGRGLDAIGISDHSYTEFDPSFCIPKERIPEYLSVLSELKERYRGRIEVLCGVEQDLFSSQSTADYDYAIGSVHYLHLDGAYHPIDESEERFIALCKTYFDGDYYALADAYFALVSEFAARPEIIMIGHFDLVAKFNEGGKLFDESHPRYLAAAARAIDRLIAAGKTFEINTGAVSRGYRSVPYPAPELCRILRNQGGKRILASDAHTPFAIAYGFEKYASLAE